MNGFYFLMSQNGCIADVAACVGVVGWDLAAICSNALLAAFFCFYTLIWVFYIQCVNYFHLHIDNV